MSVNKCYKVGDGRKLGLYFYLGIYRIYLGNYKEGVPWNLKEKACTQ